jgi:hypothetical protein
MSELYGVGETAVPASEAGAETWHEPSGERGFPGNPGSHAGGAQDGGPGSYSDAGIEDFLAAEERLPGSRTREEAAAYTWGDTADDSVGSDLATEYDGDLDALLAGEQHLPESRTRQEAAASTWDDSSPPGDGDPEAFSGDPAPEYDGDVAALLATEERLPEPCTRQEAAAATWGDTSSGQDSAPDTGTANGSPSQPGDGPQLPPHSDEDVDGPFERQVAVHTTDGTDVPVTVAYLSPEDRTVGDTTPTGVGRKPTGEEIFDMEGDESGEGLLDRLLNKATEGADDLHDTVGNAAETVHDLRLPGPAPGGGHVHEVHPVQEPAPSAGPAVSDLFGSAALVGVALLTGIRYGARHFGKGDGR